MAMWIGSARRVGSRRIVATWLAGTRRQFYFQQQWRQCRTLHGYTAAEEKRFASGTQTAGVPKDRIEQWRGRAALITGASAGIGYEVAKLLVQLGMNVVGCSRNPVKTEALSVELSSCAPGKLLAVKCDVRKEEDILATFEKAKAEFGGVDVCVNSAGLGHISPLLSGTTDDWREMLEVNVLAVCVCTREFVKQLRERGVDDGHIILLNSMRGHQVPPAAYGHFYSATKFAITAITEGLRQELREMNTSIKVTAISPGPVRTEFLGRMTKTDPEEAKKQYDKTYDQVLETEDIASAVAYALFTPPRMKIHDMIIYPTKQIE